jgi:hypothetical protein
LFVVWIILLREILLTIVILHLLTIYRYLLLYRSCITLKDWAYLWFLYNRIYFCLWSWYRLHHHALFSDDSI